MRTPVVRWLLLIVLACVPMLAAGADAPATGPTLSPRQSEWLGRHPTIILGLYDSGWPPFESIRDGRLEGLGYDYMTLVAQRLGVQVEVRRYNDWSEVLDAACRGEVDVVMNITLTADRTLCMVYTRGYVDAPLAVVGRLDDTRTSTDPDLQGLRVVTERDIHALVEKPAGVYTKQVAELNAYALTKPELSFGIMFNQRNNPLYIRLKER